jgi:hypothetical protein
MNEPMPFEFVLLVIVAFCIAWGCITYCFAWIVEKFFWKPPSTPPQPLFQVEFSPHKSRSWSWGLSESDKTDDWARDRARVFRRRTPP